MEDAEETTHPRAVVATVSHTLGRRETLQVSVTFFDGDDAVITHNDDLVKNLASEQTDDFTVRLDAGRPARVATYGSSISRDPAGTPNGRQTECGMPSVHLPSQQVNHRPRKARITTSDLSPTEALRTVGLDRPQGILDVHPVIGRVTSAVDSAE